MYKKGMVFAVIVLFIGASVVPGTSGYDSISEEIFYVDDNWNSQEDVNLYNPTLIWQKDAFKEIQDAINKSDDGYNILVRNGEYKDIDIFYKINLTAIEDKDDTIIIGDTKGDIVTITCPQAKISGFTIRNSGIKYAGIYIDTNSVNISNNNIMNVEDNGKFGIKLDKESSDNIIFKNNITENEYGIFFDEESTNNKIYNNNITENEYGIYLKKTLYDEINRSNNITMNKYGIYSYESYHSTISWNNIFINEVEGIHLKDSTYSEIINNTFSLNGINIYGNDCSHWNTHTIINNTANGRNITYFKDIENGVTVSNDAAQIILAHCSHFTLQELDIRDVDNGIQLGFSSYNIIKNNYVYGNSNYGIYLMNSSNNDIENNDILVNHDGIYLEESFHNDIFNRNIIDDNERSGIYLKDSYRNNITRRTSNDVKNRIIRNGIYGIILEDSYDNEIKKNEIINNDNYGFYIENSTINRIVGNLIGKNKEKGIYLTDGSNDNNFFENSFQENGNVDDNAYDEGRNNWDNGEEGNFWSDYEEGHPDYPDRYEIPPYKHPRNYDDYPIGDDDPPELEILTPKEGYIYFQDKNIMWEINEFFSELPIEFVNLSQIEGLNESVAIGSSITVSVVAVDNKSGVELVAFYFDNDPEPKEVIYEPSEDMIYSWNCEFEERVGGHTFKVVVYDKFGNCNSGETEILNLPTSTILLPFFITIPLLLTFLPVQGISSIIFIIFLINLYLLMAP